MKHYLNIIQSRLQSRKSFSIILAWHILRIKKLLKIDFNIKDPSDTKIDLVIPTVSKDFDLLQEVLKAAKKNIVQPINKIFIVSRKDLTIEKFCSDNGYVFVDELSVLGYGKDAITYMVGNVNRNGWMFQQLLKLSGEKFVEMENYFVVDSDTILIRPHSLIENGAWTFFQNEEWNQPYFDSFKTLLGYDAPTTLSYTSHMMIFNTDNLRRMKKELEEKHGISWDKAYVSTASPTEPSCISDYDTYANWVLYNLPGKVKNRVFYNKGLSRDYFASWEELAKKYGRKYNSLSFHSYISK